VKHLKRTNLKVFRVKLGLSQAEFAAFVGVTRNTYAAVESGKSCGRLRFWENLRIKFDLRESELKELKKTDEENGKA
jgi:DNA-binding XRE family transcriptional regulator